MGSDVEALEMMGKLGKDPGNRFLEAIFMGHKVLTTGLLWLVGSA